MRGKNLNASYAAAVVGGAALLLGAGQRVRASAPVNPAITWGTPTTISGDSDVLTTGTLVGAFDTGFTGVPGATVNGVAFQPFAVPSDIANATTTVGNFALHFDFRAASNSAFGSTSAPFSGLSSAYRTLLQSAAYDTSPDAITLTISGLTSGQTYNLELWANFPSSSFASPTTVTSTNSVNLDPNTTNTIGGVGQYVIGSFTANPGGTEVVTLSAAATPLINAFQLRTSAVPEPASLGVLAAGTSSLMLRRRKR